MVIKIDTIDDFENEFNQITTKSPPKAPTSPDKP